MGMDSSFDGSRREERERELSSRLAPGSCSP